MILGGDIYQMHTKKRDPYLKKEDRGLLDHVVIDANGLSLMPMV
jgi:hypothetical protein